MRTDIEVPGGAGIPQIRTGDKMDFARHVQALPAARFAAFASLVQIIEEFWLGSGRVKTQ